jgi:adenylate kinase family enzyme
MSVKLPVEQPRRILITGQSGSGKSTLARRMGAALGIEATDLDPIYREGGGNGPLRATDLRDADLAAVAARPSWIADGIHLDGTAPMMDAADLIIWLDHTTGWRASVRIVRRFIGGAWYEVRHQHGWRRFLRFGDYARHLRDLSRAIPESRAYSSDGHRAPIARTEVEQRLSSYRAKVVRCVTDDDVEAVVNLLTASATAS